MKQISKVFIAIGLGIMFLGGMLDADGEMYILLLSLLHSELWLHLWELRSWMWRNAGKKSGKHTFT